MAATVCIPKDLYQTFCQKVAGQDPEPILDAELKRALLEPEKLLAGEFQIYQNVGDSKPPAGWFKELPMEGAAGEKLQALAKIYSIEADDIFANAIANALKVDLTEYASPHGQFQPLQESIYVDVEALEKYKRELNSPEMKTHLARVNRTGRTADDLKRDDSNSTARVM